MDSNIFKEKIKSSVNVESITANTPGLYASCFPATSEKAFEKAASFFENQKSEDESHKFGMLVADQLRHFPISTQHEAQTQMLQLLNKIENETYFEKQS